MSAGISETLAPVVVLLASGVVAVPLFRRLGLGSVLGYFAAGLLVGPSVLGVFTDPETILHVSELGVVMLLFLIGLEMRPTRLWSLRRQIFGLGAAQVLTCLVLLALVGWAAGLGPAPAFIAGAGFVLSSTAVIMQLLQERGEIAGPQGQQDVSILLLEDLAIVPLLAAVTLLAPGTGGEGMGPAAILGALAAVAGLIAAGIWLLDPFFALLARARTQEVLTAGALLVVLGAAFVMEQAGLSMAMGAFLAGVMLSGSSYRHQIESDVEPFKGLLMGLFFLAVGMSLDLRVVREEWLTILGLLAAFILAKAAGIYAVARAFRAAPLQAVRRATLFAQGGEFAFVLYAAAGTAGVIDTAEGVLFSTVIILSMAVTPLILLAADRLLPQAGLSLDGVEEARGLRGQVLVIGFGRMGQVASQVLLSQDIALSIIDNDPERVREAARFGSKIYYGDGTRLDILRHSGAENAEAIVICVDHAGQADRIVALAQAEFPMAKLIVRAFDRRHSIRLIRAGVEVAVRETFEAAVRMGATTLKALGMEPSAAEDAAREIRRRDRERLDAQIQQDGLAPGGAAGAGAAGAPPPHPRGGAIGSGCRCPRWRPRRERVQPVPCQPQVVLGQVVSGRQQRLAHGGAGIPQIRRQPVGQPRGHDRIGGAGKDQHRHSRQPRAARRPERRHGAQQDRPRQQARMAEQERRRHVGAVGKPDRHWGGQPVGRPRPGDEIGQIRRPGGQIGLVEHASRQPAKEARQAVFADPAAGGEQRRAGCQGRAQRDQIALVPAGAVQQQERRPVGRAGNVAVDMRKGGHRGASMAWRGAGRSGPVGVQAGSGESEGSAASIRARSASYCGGSFSDSPRCAGVSSTAKPGTSVAISNSTPPGERK